MINGAHMIIYSKDAEVHPADAGDSHEPGGALAVYQPRHPKP